MKYIPRTVLLGINFLLSISVLGCGSKEVANRLIIDSLDSENC